MTLERLFLTVLEISVASIPVITLLLLLSPLLGKRYAPSLRCLLWLALAIRLVLPVNLPWRHAFQLDLFPSAQPQAVQTGWFLPNPALTPETEPKQEAEKQNAVPGQENARRKAVKIPPVTLPAAWAAATAMFLLYHLGAYFHTLRRLRRWSTPVSDQETLDMLEAVKQDLSIRGEVRLYRSAKAASPLLVGFARPRVILPERPLAPEQLDFMLRHELWHLKRGDLWRKLLMLLANAMHWFNPFVWLLDRRACLDAELACDADVLREAGGGERKEYGYAVLSFMEQGWRCKTPLTSRFYGGKRQMKQRFYNIADTSAKKRGTLVFCAAAIIIALAGCAVNATGSAGQENPAEAQTSPVLISDEPQPELSAPAQERSREIIDGLHDVIEWSKDPYTGGEMAWPLPGSTRIIRPFGESPQIPDDIHTGLDIAGEHGKPIIAANDGVVKKIMAEYTPGVGYGMYVIIDHGGEISTLYAHCSKILVGEGENVAKGTYIAETGATGFAQEPHLHFEVRVSGKTADPIPYVTSNGFMWPASGGEVITVFRGYPGHTGMDIGGLPEGSPVYAAASGTVVKAQDANSGYGKHIIIDHGNGFQTLYAHNSELYASVGDVVAKGQTIAAVGRSGNTTDYALHFEIRQDGKVLNPGAYVTAPDSPATQRDYTESEPLQPDWSHEPADHTIRIVPLDPEGSAITYTVEIGGETVVLTPKE